MIETDITWPAGLPNPLIEGHSLQAGRPFQRTSLLNGRAKQRRRFSTVPVEGVFSYVFTGPQASFFEAWFSEILKDGIEWFKTPRKTPLGMRMLVVRFTDMYSGPSLVGRDRWRYDCPLEIYEREFMDKEWFILPEMWLGMDIFDIAMNREWPLHEVTSG